MLTILHEETGNRKEIFLNPNINLHFQIIDDLSYTGPAIGAAKLNEKLKELGHNNNVSIVDLGCGTGLVGEQLYNLGYKNIDGMDLSENMLKDAEEKGIYRYLRNI